MTRARPPLWFLLVAVAIAIVVAVYLWQQSGTQLPQPAPPAQPEPHVEAPPAPAPPPTAEPVEPQVLHPIETAQQQLESDTETAPGEEATPLTPEESDVAMQEALAGLYGADLGQFFYLNDFIRRIVVTVDNLPRRQVASRLSPMKPPSGLFVTTGKEGSLYLSPENYARYAPYVRLLQSADPKKVVAVYVRLYPLFQQAYQELGYPKGYFNDRLVEVVDHLLAAPDVPLPIKLIQPRVLYQFEDPKLESLSAGEKGLIRMGSANASQVKAYLREIRQALTGQLPPQ
jgi:hypothetical protein